MRANQLGELPAGVDNDPGDGTIGGVAQKCLEHRHAAAQRQGSSTRARGAAGDPTRRGGGLTGGTGGQGCRAAAP